MSPELSAREIHVKAERAREDDHLDEALNLFTKAIVDYQKEGNWEGAADALMGRALTHKHFFWRDNNLEARDHAKQDAEMALNIAKHHNLTSLYPRVYFLLGEVVMLCDDYKVATTNYMNGLASFGGSLCERGNWTSHVGQALYKSGEKEEGKAAFKEGLKLIKENRDGVDPFLANVWESGAHMRMAECLRNDEPDIAREHLELCRQIINSDPRLVIRKRQLEELQRLFN